MRDFSEAFRNMLLLLLTIALLVMASNALRGEPFDVKLAPVCEEAYGPGTQNFELCVRGRLIP